MMKKDVHGRTIKVSKSDRCNYQMQICFYSSILKIRKFHQVEVENEVLQDYKGPDTPVDLILLTNMMNYIAESAKYQITRCLQWFKPGGHLLIVGRDRSTYMDTVLRMS